MIIQLVGECDTNPQEGPQGESRELQASQLDLGASQNFGEVNV